MWGVLATVNGFHVLVVTVAVLWLCTRRSGRRL